MAAAYDTYDYPGYWIGREYEHEAEIFAIKSFLKKIPVIKNVVEIGAGFGRLVPAYFFRARRVVLTDPSSKLLKIANRHAFCGEHSEPQIVFSLHSPGQECQTRRVAPYPALYILRQRS